MSYYLTKSNPNVYRLQDALNFYHNELGEMSWTVVKQAKRGDTLYIGQSG